MRIWQKSSYEDNEQLQKIINRQPRFIKICEKLKNSALDFGGPGLFIHAAREAKGYTMEEISRGICSLSTLSRIETGERVADYSMIEALLERMKVEK